ALNRQGLMHDTWWIEDAASKLLRAQYIRQRILAPNDPDRAESLEFLAQSLFVVREFSQAERLLNEALAIRRDNQSAGHPDLSRPRSLLGACLGLRGDSSRAVLEIHDALAITEAARGPKHPVALGARILAGVVKNVAVSDCLGTIREMRQVQE